MKPRNVIHHIVFCWALAIAVSGCHHQAESSGAMRISQRTTVDGTTICELDITNRSLKEVCLALSRQLEKPIRLKNVAPDRRIENMHIEKNDWMGVLNGFVEGMGDLKANIEEDEIILTAE
jgi:hypothetical protein